VQGEQVAITFVGHFEGTHQRIFATDQKLAPHILRRRDGAEIRILDACEFTTIVIG
jgi:hypothetical protein